MSASPLKTGVELHAPGHHARHALSDAKRHLQTRALKLAGYVVFAYVVLKLIPALKRALHALEHVSGEWVLGAIALEVLSETGFVIAWSAIVDPENLLSRDGRGRGMDERVAWTQLGGGLLLPGGAWGGAGVGALILHWFGTPAKLIAERQSKLSFLNTAIGALALVLFGVGLATGIFAGEGDLLLSLFPAAAAGAGIAAVALLVAPHAWRDGERLQARHPKIPTAITTLADAVKDTERLLFHRGAWASVLGIVAYLRMDVLVLWTALLAIHAHPLPGFPVVIMA